MANPHGFTIDIMQQGGIERMKKSRTDGNDPDENGAFGIYFNTFPLGSFPSVVTAIYWVTSRREERAVLICHPRYPFHRYPSHRYPLSQLSFVTAILCHRYPVSSPLSCHRYHAATGRSVRLGGAAYWCTAKKSVVGLLRFR